MSSSEEEEEEDAAHLTKGQWRRLRTLRAKEDMWLDLYGYRLDYALINTPITTPQQAMRVYAPKLNDRDMKNRALARRAYIAAMKGGRCEAATLAARKPELRLDAEFRRVRRPFPCTEEVRDYRFLRMWEFNHVTSRALVGGFVISGSDCARRAWPRVRDHALNDTVLLCRECHWIVTNLEKRGGILAQAVLFRERLRPRPDQE